MNFDRFWSEVQGDESCRDLGSKKFRKEKPEKSPGVRTGFVPVRNNKPLVSLGLGES